MCFYQFNSTYVFLLKKKYHLFIDHPIGILIKYLSNASASIVWYVDCWHITEYHLDKNLYVNLFAWCVKCLLQMTFDDIKRLVMKKMIEFFCCDIVYASSYIDIMHWLHYFHQGILKKKKQINRKSNLDWVNISCGVFFEYLCWYFILIQ